MDLPLMFKGSFLGCGFEVLVIDGCVDSWGDQLGRCHNLPALAHTLLGDPNSCYEVAFAV